MKMVKTTKQENAERLVTMKQYLKNELTRKKPCKIYVEDLQLSISRLEHGKAMQ
jgi:hypothetical protein